MSHRQRILYLNSISRGIHSQVVAWALHEPVKGHMPTIETNGAPPPYETVHSAVTDGWRVVHFPDQRVDSDPVEPGVLGYEFILEQIIDHAD